MSHLTHSRPAASISPEDNRSLVLSHGQPSRSAVCTLHGHINLELFHAVHVVSMISIFGHYQVSTKTVAMFLFLADRTNGRAYATMLRASVVYSCLSVTLCIVAKRCVLEQNLLLTACRKSCMRNRLVAMTLAFVYM